MQLYIYWEIIKERKWVVVTAFLVTVFTTFLGSLLWPPKYEAVATLVLDYDSSNPMNLSILPGVGMLQSSEYINTQIEVIKSRKVALGVIDHLKLDKIPDIIEEFNWVRWKNRVFFWKNEKNLDIKVWLADEFLSKYLVVEPAKYSRFLYVKFYSPDPDFSAAVANSYAKVYTDYSLELKVTPFKEASKWFSDKLKDVKVKADSTSEQLRTYQKKKGFISNEGRYYDDAIQTLDQLNKELVAANAKLNEVTIAIHRVKESGGAYESLPEVLSNAFIQSLKIEKIRLEKGLSEISAKVGEKHPQYLRLQSELQTINSKLDSEIKNIIDVIKKDYNSAHERVGILEKKVVSHKDQALNLNISRYEIESLNRESEASKQAYDIVLKKFNETFLQSDINRTNVFIVDAAVVPTEKYSPKFFKNMALAVLAGSFLGLGFAFIFHYMDDTIKTWEVIEREFGILGLGSIPAIKGK